MASIWKGSLTFGLVSIPVELKAAVRSEEHVTFRLLHAEDLSPVRYDRVCQADGETVAWSDIVKGYEYEKGKFVVLTEQEIKSAALESSKTLEILDFVKQEEIDPRYFETPYYVVATKGGEKAYALLREAIRESAAVGIGKITIRQKEHLAGVKVVGDAIVLELMRFAGELVDESEYTFPKAESVRPQELKMARELIDNLADSFNPSKYTDEYRANLMKVIRAKMKGKKITASDTKAAPEDAKVLDLMARLRASLDDQKGKRRRGRGKRQTA
ncbi:MAG: Ku protein [Gemmatimonadaceae bacterium]